MALLIGGCAVCQDNTPGELCGRCSKGRAFNALRSAALYNRSKEAQERVGSKYSNDLDSYMAVVPSMARDMAAVIEREGWGAGWLTFVPMEPGKRSRRTFNQAEVLADAVGKLTGQPTAETLALDAERIPQRDRREGARGDAIPIRRIVKITDGSYPVILIDDVATTGATLEESAFQLQAAGAQTVYALTYARVRRNDGKR